MAKHIFRREDEERTELLGHDELFVQKGKGSDTYYNAWLHDSEIECCPRCGSDAVMLCCRLRNAIITIWISSSGMNFAGRYVAL